jgi:peptidoglycan/xylan/chitin deacetylase (PgdA/CDA1 family)
MDIFISKNQSLTLGLIMNAIGNDEKIINKVQQGSDSGLFELGINGWNTTDYTKLSQKEQQYSLKLANQKMQTLFGNTSDIFIPPEGEFNNDTLKAMNRNNIEILSNSIYAEDNINEGKSRLIADTGIANKTGGIFHLPNTISFKDYIGDKWIKNSIETILSNITQDLEKYGYSIIALRPQHFMKIDSNGDLTNSLDKGEVEDLLRLIDSILLRHINITSFSKLVGITPRVYAYPNAYPNSNLRPYDPILLDRLSDLEYAMAEIYNTYGKYLYEKALQLGISPATAAAVLYVESRGSGFGTDGRLTIRFEACTFYELWGKKI